MPRLSIKKIAGRPPKPIDWQRVDELLEAGCHGSEIAPHFDMHPDTFYAQVQQKYGKVFTEYAAEKRQKGESNLREVQYKRALRGENTLLIWLGKNRLNQKENPDQGQIDPKTIEQFKAIMEMLQQAQSASNNALSNINNAEKS